MQHLEVSCALRRLFKSLGFKGLIMRIFRHSTEEAGGYKKLYDQQGRRWQGLRLGGEI